MSYNYFSDVFEVRVDQSYGEGEQVFISYGKQSNDRLLQFYGFVEADNPFDSFDFNLTFVELMLKHADSISDPTSFNIPVPSDPSPPDRIRRIARAMKNTMVDDVKLSDGTGTSLSNRNKKRDASEVTCRIFRTPPSPSLPSPPLMNRFDDVTVRAMRALYCSPEEFRTCLPEGEGVSLQTLGINVYHAACILYLCIYEGTPLSASTEQKLLAALKAILQLELEQFPTSLSDDLQLLSGETDEQLRLARLFRIEKKKLLMELTNY